MLWLCLVLARQTQKKILKHRFVCFGYSYMYMKVIGFRYDSKSFFKSAVSLDCLSMHRRRLLLCGHLSYGDKGTTANKSKRK